MNYKNDVILYDGEYTYVCGKYREFMKTRFNKMSVVDRNEFGAVSNEFINLEDNSKLGVMVLKSRDGKSKELGMFIRHCFEVLPECSIDVIRLDSTRYAVNIQGEPYVEVFRKEIKFNEKTGKIDWLMHRGLFTKTIKESDSGIVMEFSINEPSKCIQFRDVILKNLTHKILPNQKDNIVLISKEESNNLIKGNININELVDKNENDVLSDAMFRMLEFSKRDINKYFQLKNTEIFHELKSSYTEKTLIRKLKDLGFIPVKSSPGDYVYNYNGTFIVMGLYDEDGDGNLEFKLESSNKQITKREISKCEKEISHKVGNM